jgi:hypothetical protein
MGKGGVMKLAASLLVVPLAASLMFHSPALGEISAGTKVSAGKKIKRAKITVRPKRPWRGYGFLPGYRPSLAESQGVPVFGPRRPRREVRYIDYYGNVRYGWGPPRYYRGRWNAGSFGPCWTSTPIGLMWTCGQ